MEKAIDHEQLAAIEAELAKLTADDLLLQSLVALVNLGVRRAGLGPAGPTEQSLEQLKTCIDAAGAIIAILEGRQERQLRPIRDALAQLQMACARLSTG